MHEENTPRKQWAEHSFGNTASSRPAMRETYIHEGCASARTLGVYPKMVPFYPIWEEERRNDSQARKRFPRILLSRNRGKKNISPQWTEWYCGADCHHRPIHRSTVADQQRCHALGDLLVSVRLQQPLLTTRLNEDPTCHSIRF